MKRMILTYDAERGAFYLYVTKKLSEVNKTKSDGGVYVDLDKNNKLLGLEFLTAKKLSRIPALLKKYNT
jgi:uncharacterized protein YuzE